MKTRSTEELIYLLNENENVSISVIDDEVNIVITVRNDEEYYLEGDRENLNKVGFYNSNNNEDDFIIDYFKEKDVFNKIENQYLIFLDNYLDNSMDEMRNESINYYSNRDY